MNLFLTPISLGEFTPVNVRGSVSLANSSLSGISIFPDGLDFESVDGIKMAVAFIGDIFTECNAYKGYTYENLN